ncbi:MAG: O-antigen ligase family protein [Candidatus Firestonebacteria bacterium]
MAFKYLSQKAKVNVSASLAILLFAVYAFVSVFYSVNQPISFRWALEFTFYAGLFAAVVHIANGNKNVCFGLLNIALISGFLVSIIGIFQYFHLDFVFKVSNFTGRISSTLGNANFLGGYLILLIPVSMALFFVVKSVLYKSVYAVNTVFLVVALFFTQTLNAWIGLALGVLVFAVLFIIYISRYRKLMVFSALALIAVASLLVVTFKPQEAMEKFEKIGRFETFAERGRWLMWKTAVEMIKEEPIKGFGAGTYRVRFTEYEAKLLKKKEFAGYPHIITKDAHNDYLQICSELGITGLLLLLLFIGSVILGAVRNLSKTENDKKIIYIGLLCALIAFLVHMFFNFPLKIAPSAVLFFMFLGLLASGYGVYEVGFGTNKIRAVIFSLCLALFLVAVPLQMFLFLSNLKLGMAVESSAKKKVNYGLKLARASLVYSEIAGNTIDLRTHFYLGELNYRLLNYKDAEEEFKKEVALNPYYPDARYNLGLIQEINGNYEEAYKNYSMTLDIDPGFEGVSEKMERIKNKKQRNR